MRHGVNEFHSLFNIICCHINPDIFKSIRDLTEHIVDVIQTRRQYIIVVDDKAMRKTLRPRCISGFPKGRQGVSENVTEGRTVGLALCLYKILSMNYLNVKENSHHWCEKLAGAIMLLL